MIASLMMANFDVFDVTMSDLHAKKITLDAFQGLVFPGGFSYAGKSFYIKINSHLIFKNKYDYVNYIGNIFHLVLVKLVTKLYTINCSRRVQ